MSIMPAFARYDTPEERDFIALMVRRANAGALANAAGAFLIALVALFAPFWKLLMIALALRLVTVGLTGLMGKLLERDVANARPLLPGINRMCASLFFGGASWASIIIVIPVSAMASIEALSLVALVLVGLTIVTMVVSPVTRAMWSFVGGFTVLCGAHLLMNLEQMLPFAVTMAGLVAIISSFALRLSRDTRRTIRLDAENRKMADTLGTLNLELGEALDRADKLARFDQLTSVRNRRAFEEEAHAIAVRRDRGRNWFAMIIDLDHFKKVNDVHGHFVGDEYLRRVGAILANVEHLQDHGVAARLGGEEFVLLLSAAGTEEAKACAEEVRERVAALSIDGREQFVETTTSIGLTRWRDKEPIHAALRRADLALYDAKRGGRDRVVVADEGGSAVRAA